MTERRGRYVAALAVSVLAVAAAYASAFLPGGPAAWAPPLMGTGVAGSLTSAMALGATRDGSLGPLAPLFLAVFVLLSCGFGAAHLLQGGSPGATGLWLGLPPPAAVILYGVGFLPLVLVPGAYALTFERLTLDDDDWARIRAVRDGPGVAEPPDDRTDAGGTE